MWKISMILTLVVALAGCAQESVQTVDAVEGFRVEPGTVERGWAETSGLLAESESRQRQAPADDGRKIIKTIQLSLGVDETDEVAARVQRLAKDHGGYVAGLSSSNHEGRQYQITIRVPVESVTAVMAGLKGLATVVDHENLSSRDVTDQFVDLEARIRALEGTERELMSLLAESRSRHYKVKDIMAIYTELTQIRSRIEQHQGQLNQLDNQSALATISVSLRPVGLPTVPTVEQWQPLVTLRDSYRVLVGVFHGLVDTAIVASVVFVPLLVTAVLALWLLWKLVLRTGLLVRAPVTGS